MFYVVLVLSDVLKHREEQGPLKERCLHPKAGPKAVKALLASQRIPYSVPGAENTKSPDVSGEKE